MKDGFKWCPTVCPSCGNAVQPFIAPIDEPEPIISPYPCWDCEHTDVVALAAAQWRESDRKILTEAARGEVLDCNGNPVPAIVCRTNADGKYECHRYGVDLFGELYEVTQ